MRLAALTALLFTAAVPAAAQVVGLPPGESPFRDIRDGYVGNVMYTSFWGDGGEVDVGPGTGSFLGFRFDLKATDPISIGLGVMTGTPEREVIDPALSPETRVLGTIEERITLVEVDLQFTVTGAKTWNGLAPYLGTGVGVAIGEGDEDIGGYKFGAKLFLAPMIGTRYFLSDRLFLRAEARAILWKLTYPDSYQQPWPLNDVDADPEDAVLPGGPESEWVMSPTLSFGLGYSFRL